MVLLGLLLVAGLVTSYPVWRHSFLKGMVSPAAFGLEAGDAAGRCVLRVSRSELLGRWHVLILNQNCWTVAQL